MKKQLLFKNSYLIAFLLGTLSLASCTDNEDIDLDSRLYSGSNTDMRASIVSDMKSKQSTVEITQDVKWKLYGGNTESSINFQDPVWTGISAGRFQLNANRFQLYCLEWADGVREVLALRQLPIEGQPNFRDLGGYKTIDGRHVKWGVVFRSGKCNALTNEDLSYLATIPLKTVIDFRSDDERKTEPDRLPNSVTTQLHYGIDPGNLSTIDISDAIKRGDVAASKQFLIDGNKAFVMDFQAEYTAFFETLLKGTMNPIMFHCTAGKDRAGLASALFLCSLGVDKETVIKDYLLTNELTGVTVESMKKLYGDTNTAMCMYYLYSVQREYIEMAFSTIENNYGSIDRFLTQQLKVDLNKMRAMYLH